MSTSPSAVSPLAEKIMNLVWWKPAPDLGEQTRRKVAFHLVPYLFFLYILAYLDRTNIAVAQFGMGKPIEEGGLSFDPRVIGWGFGMFFLGYWILEIPSTVSVVKWGARWVFVRILVLWGLACALIGLIGLPIGDQMFGWLDHSFWTAIFDAFGWVVREIFSGNPGDLANSHIRQFYFLRFMLGFFEGGFFPSVIVYLSLWFRPRDRAKAIASFMIAIPVSSVLGNPLSGALLNVNWFDLHGWRWIFILQGVVPVFAGFLTLFFLPDRPQRAKWLTDQEKDWLLGELEKEHQAKAAHGHGHFVWMSHLGAVLFLTLYYFCMNVTSYGLSTFMPAIIKSQTGWGDSAASYLTAVPYFMGFLAMLVNGWHSDKTQERIWHVATPLLCLSAGLFLAATLTPVVDPQAESPERSVWPVLIMLFVVGTCMYAHLPAYWPIPSTFLGGVVAASAVGFINMIGNLGGTVGPVLVGEKAKTGFREGLFTLAPFPLYAAIIILGVGQYIKHRQRKAALAPVARKENALTLPSPPSEGVITERKPQ